MKQRVHLEWIGGYWRWKAKTNVNGVYFMEIGRTKKSALRRLKREIRRAALHKYQPETVVMEID